MSCRFASFFLSALLVFFFSKQPATVEAASSSTIPVFIYKGELDLVEFKKHVDDLLSQGYQTISPSDYANWLKGSTGSAFPKKPIFIGFENQLVSYSPATDVLLNAGFQATMFISVKLSESTDSAYLSWEDIKALVATGIWHIQLSSGAQGDTLENCLLPIPKCGRKTCEDCPYCSNFYNCLLLRSTKASCTASSNTVLESQEEFQNRIQNDVIDGENTVPSRLGLSSWKNDMFLMPKDFTCSNTNKMTFKGYSAGHSHRRGVESTGSDFLNCLSSSTWFSEFATRYAAVLLSDEGFESGSNRRYYSTLGVRPVGLAELFSRLSDPRFSYVCDPSQSVQTYGEWSAWARVPSTGNTPSTCIEERRFKMSIKCSAVCGGTCGSPVLIDSRNSGVNTGCSSTTLSSDLSSTTGGSKSGSSTPNSVIWPVFGVAVGLALLALVALVAYKRRENQRNQNISNSSDTSSSGGRILTFPRSSANSLKKLMSKNSNANMQGEMEWDDVIENPVYGMPGVDARLSHLYDNRSSTVSSSSVSDFRITPYASIPAN